MKQSNPYDYYSVGKYCLGLWLTWHNCGVYHLTQIGNEHPREFNWNSCHVCVGCNGIIKILKS